LKIKRLVKFYPENLSIGVCLFYLIVSLAIASGLYGLVKIIASILKKEFNPKYFVPVLTVAFFIVFLLLILTDQPYKDNR